MEKRLPSQGGLLGVTSRHKLTRLKPTGWERTTLFSGFLVSEPLASSQRPLVSSSLVLAHHCFHQVPVWHARRGAHRLVLRLLGQRGFGVLPGFLRVEALERAQQRGEVVARAPRALLLLLRPLLGPPQQLLEYQAPACEGAALSRMQKKNLASLLLETWRW